MKFGKLLFQSAAVFFFIVFFSLVGAITPQVTNVRDILSVPSYTIIFLITVIVVMMIGTVLGMGVKGIKSSGSLLMAYISALILGGMLALFTFLNLPYTVHVHLNWLGNAWYDPWLVIFFIGTPLILIFVA